MSGMTGSPTGTFLSPDGLRLAYEEHGTGRPGAPPLVCVPGGPGGSAAYLGDLGGLDRRRRLVLLYNRGTGASETPDDPAALRFDRIVGDVEALRAHLGVERIDLLGHSAAASVAMLYATAHPDRLAHLVLLTGGLRLLGLPNVDADAADAARAGEPWHAGAAEAIETLSGLGRDADPATVAELERALDPYMYGTWDDRARAHADLLAATRSAVARDGFYGDYPADPERARARMAELDVPVLVISGERDVSPTPAASAGLASVFRNGRHAMIVGGGHYPWLENPEAFTREVVTFLGD
jgi:pimeloyl-ACP methyl ester carboxylesterase